MKYKENFQICGLVIVWYFSSATAVLLSKGLFSGKIGNVLAFGFPLTITIVSNIVCYIIAKEYVRTSTEQDEDDGQYRYAFFIGVLTAGEIGLKGLALKELTVTLSTIMKGTSPLFVLAWGMALRIYATSYRMISVVVLVAIGLFIAVSGQETLQRSTDSFHYGVVAAFIAGVISGLRWVITQIFIKGETVQSVGFFREIIGNKIDREISPISAIFLTAPYTAAAVFPFAIILEGENLCNWIKTVQVREVTIVACVSLSIGCCVFVYLWSGYELVKRTSSLTVSIGTVVRELMTIMASIIVFGDHLTVQGFLGFSLVQIGIVMYALEKSQPANSSHERIPLLDEHDYSGILS